MSRGGGGGLHVSKERGDITKGKGNEKIKGELIHLSALWRELDQNRPDTMLTLNFFRSIFSTAI